MTTGRPYGGKRQGQRRRGGGKRPAARERVSTHTMVLDILRVGAQGDGVAERDGHSIFVSGAVTGDVVEAEVNLSSRGAGIGTMLSLIRPGHDRAEPRCPHFGACGGCQLQMMTDQAYARWTEERVRAALVPHSLPLNAVRPTILTRPGTRRRLALKALRRSDGVILGFTRRKSHEIVALTDCTVARPALVALFDPLRSLLASVLPAGGTATVHLTDALNGIDVVLEGNIALGLPEREALSAFALTHDLTSLHVDRDGFLDPVLLRRHPVLHFDGVAVTLPPAAFLQASQDGEAALVRLVCEATKPGGRALDLFSGLGTFSLPLARNMTVHAVEGMKAPLEALARAAGQAGDRPVTTEHRDLFRRPLRPEELKPYDIAVFDPPRAGAEAQAEMLAGSDISVVMAVSCNPNTFARDAAILEAGGYRLDYIQPVDQFLWSPHMELVARFTREMPS